MTRLPPSDSIFKIEFKMNRITNLFQTQKDGILSVYFTAGYPNLNDTASILKALQAKGIHMVEVGIPFSDPMADGPVIQEAATQALRNGMSLHLLFEQLKEIRSEVQIPIILMGYLNPIMQYGFEKFCASCVEAGVDGMIIPDLPYADYIADYKEIADRHDLKMIMLIALFSNVNRHSAVPSAAHVPKSSNDSAISACGRFPRGISRNSAKSPIPVPRTTTAPSSRRPETVR